MTGWSLLGVVVLLTIAGFVLTLLGPEPAPQVDSTIARYVTPSMVAGFGIAILAFAAVGALVLYQRPRNAIGWLFSTAGLLMAITMFSAAYAFRALLADPGSLPGGRFVGLAADVLYLPLFSALTVFLFLLFPDGRLRIRGERIAAFAAGFGVGLGALGTLVEPHLYSFPEIENPLHVPALEVVYGWAAGLGGALVFGSLAASIVFLVRRLRRAAGRERDQLRVLVWAAVLSTAFLGPVFFASDPGSIQLVLAGVGVVLMPLSVGVAILRHGLLDIDLVIRRTVVFGLLAAFIAVVYLAVAVAIPAVILGRRGERFDGLPFIAAAVIALAFQPVRDRARRLAARLVYGERATPYEVLSRLASRMAATDEAQDLLPRIARVMAEGTGASRAAVWLRIGDELRPATIWPNQEQAPAPVRMSGPELPALSAQLVVAVEHRGELLGALCLDKPAEDPISPTEERLIQDVASQSGLALYNVRLTEELRATVDELQASRQRLVRAQDEGRCRLERNIHDGAQQQLVALTVKARLGRELAERDPIQAVGFFEQVEAEAKAALEDLRDLARGIFPPLLADKGLAAALEAQARKVPFPVTLDVDGIGRYPQEVEAAVYFSCLEALQNVAKYADASTVRVALSVHDGLAFEVADDGRGSDTATISRGTGLQGIVDRVAAIGGSVDVRSSPGGGTTVAGYVPAASIH